MTETVDLLDTRQAAEYLGLSPVTLKIYRSQGRGPRYVRAERNPRWIRYRSDDLDDYRADMDAAVETFATRAVAMTDALGKLADDELDALFSSLMRAEAANREADRPTVADLYRRMMEWLLAEYARRGCKPNYLRRPAEDAAPTRCSLA